MGLNLPMVIGLIKKHLNSTGNVTEQQINNINQIPTLSEQLAQIENNEIYCNITQFNTLQEGINYCIENNKNIFIPNAEFEVETLLVQNANNIKIKIDGVLKRINGSTVQNSLLNIVDSNNIYIDRIGTDGNIINNKANNEFLNEHMHSVSLRNCNNIYIDTILDKETCGDTLYINNCNDVYVNKIKTNNTTMCGRNCVSIVSGVNMTFNDIVGINIGVPSMPGGFDIEPNQQSETVKNIRVNNAYFETSGTHCFAICNNFNSTIENIYMKGTVIKHGNTEYYCAYAQKCSNVNINVTVKNKNTQDNMGLWITGCKDSKFNVNATNLLNGIYADDCENTVISGVIKNIKRNGVVLGANNKNCTFDLIVSDTCQEGGSSYGCVYAGGYSTGNSGLIFKGKLLKGSTGGFAIRLDSDLENSVADRVDFTGFGNGFMLFGNNAHTLLCRECIGFNYANSLTEISSNKYKQGTLVYNLTPTSNIGWVAKTDTTGTDLTSFGAI